MSYYYWSSVQRTLECAASGVIEEPNAALRKITVTEMEASLTTKGLKVNVTIAIRKGI
jgi:hypothetical protein